jgi:hypothetical protein
VKIQMTVVEAEVVLRALKKASLENRYPHGTKEHELLIRIKQNLEAHQKSLQGHNERIEDLY